MDKFRCLNCGHTAGLASDEQPDGFTWVESALPLPDTYDLKCPICGSTNVDEVDDEQ